MRSHRCAERIEGVLEVAPGLVAEGDACRWRTNPSQPSTQSIDRRGVVQAPNVHRKSVGEPSPPTAASQLGCRSRSIDAHLTSSLRGRLLAAGLYPLEDHFAAKGTSAPVVVGQADKEPLLVVVPAWVDEVGQEPAVALGGLLGLRDALRADLADPPSE
jgi:hypothetical protein